MDLDRDLFDAVEDGNAEAVNRLLDRGANPNVCAGESEMRPILVAAHHFPFLIEPLAAAGARLGREYLSKGSGRIWGPMNFAVREETGESISILCRLGVSVRDGSPLFDAACYSFTADNIRRLVALGADVDVGVGTNQNTPLLMAAYFGHAEPVRALIELGASLEARDFRGNTPLRFAVQQGHVDVVKQLLEAGAVIEPGMETPEFWSPSQFGSRELPNTLRVIAAHLTAQNLRAAMPGDGAAGGAVFGKPDVGVL